MLSKSMLFAVLAVLAPWRVAAQCPDGTPPPCGARPARAAAAANSVAVLYFDSRSRDSNDLYLAEGLTEEIISRLSGIERMTVRSRHMVQRYRGATVNDPAVVGRALNVSYIVTGSVRRTAGRLRVSAELVRAEGGAQVWGRQFDQAGDDVLAIQEAVASEVATGIVGRLLPDERRALAVRPTTSAAAYEAFLRGNFHAARRDSAGVVRALQEYETALRVDPAFVDALSRIAWTYGLAYANGLLVGIPAETLQVRSIRAAEEAVRRAPRSSDAWLAMGVALQNRSRTQALEALERAAALDSTSAEAEHMIAFTLSIMGQDSAALVHDLRALAINPARPVTVTHLVHFEARYGRYPQARGWADSALAIDPQFAVARAGLLPFLLLEGDTARARVEAAALRTSAAMRSLSPVAELLVSMAGRDSAAATALRQQVRAALPPRTPVIQMTYIAMLAMVASRDAGLVVDLLETARPRGPFLRYTMSFPLFDPIRGDARFARLYQELGP